MGAAVLTDQESAVLTTIVAALVLVLWLAWHPSIARLRATAQAGLTGLIVGSPQFIVMIMQAPANRSLGSRAGLLAANYVASGAALQQLFAPSPRLADYGLTSVSRYYHHGPFSIVIVTFGVVLTALALFGIAVSWRRRHARSLALLWLACALLALQGPVGGTDATSRWPWPMVRLRRPSCPAPGSCSPRAGHLPGGQPVH